MEQKETTTQQKSPSAENSPESVNNAKDNSPLTPSANWWGGWISQAKEKSASVLEAVKNDLNELTTAVTDTFNIAATDDDEDGYEKVSPEAESTQAKPSQPSTVNYMKQSLSSFFGSVTDALIPQLDDDDASEAVLITSDDTIVLSGFAKHLAELQSNDETYLEEPSKTVEYAEKYRMWLEIVEQDQFTQQKVDKMLESSQILNEKYNKFVPDTVSHMNFFKRYLFKKALLEDDLANEERRRKEAAVIEKQPEPVIVVEPQVDVVKDSSPNKKPIKAEMNDMNIANFELSEEEQAKLLEDYEQEIKEREKSKTDIVEPPSVPKTAMKASKNPSKSSSNVQSSKGKNNKNVKLQQHQQQKSTQQQTTKGGEKAKKSAEELKIEKDHFKKESESSTSDESWEKEFDI
ncbi:CLUMA_CG016272, isoform A [Clunio marinus]|uniref:CLUMA_CG016272, isoform A n=1 Tax=Clunio marinus TaxID=568069 RepID=A0A1J1ITP4_9DIPT|nr:CLUMA_CG016272, isoform A [Clunio marinus]